MSKFCQKCGNELPDDALFCTKCGYNFSSNNSTTYTVPQGSAPIKKKGGCLKGLLIILGALIGFIIIIMIAFGGDDNDKSNINSQQTTTTTKFNSEQIETTTTPPNSDEPKVETTTTKKEEPTKQTTTTKQTEEPVVETTEDTESSNSTLDENAIRKAVNDGDYSLVTPEFKESMDAYEECMNEYINLMYNSDKDNDAEMLMNMGTILEKQQEWTNKIDAIDETKLTPADDAYYLIVTTRVTAKMLKYSASIY